MAAAIGIAPAAVFAKPGALTKLSKATEDWMIEPIRGQYSRRALFLFSEAFK